MYIYKKDNDHFDYLSIKFLFPKVSLFEEKKSSWDNESYYQSGIRLNTEIWYTKTNCYWCFSLSVLGFGFCLTRQWGY